MRYQTAPCPDTVPQSLSKRRKTLEPITQYQPPRPTETVTQATSAAKTHLQSRSALTSRFLKSELTTANLGEWARGDGLRAPPSPPQTSPTLRSPLVIPARPRHSREACPVPRYGGRNPRVGWGRIPSPLGGEGQGEGDGVDGWPTPFAKRKGRDATFSLPLSEGEGKGVPARYARRGGKTQTTETPVENNNTSPNNPRNEKPKPASSVNAYLAKSHSAASATKNSA